MPEKAGSLPPRERVASPNPSHTVSPPNFRYTLFLGCLLCGLLSSPTCPAGMNASKLKEIDQAIEAAIAAGDIPGAVVWIESRGKVHHGAFGRRMTFPSEEKMTRDTIFDVASLTKVLATAPSILHLADRGELSLDDPVSRHIPEFLEGGLHPDAEGSDLDPAAREGITIRHLLSHHSGLPPAISLQTRDFWGHEEGIRRAATIGLLEMPESRFRYSDVNFILLGEIVRRVSGRRLDVYAAEVFYRPLGLKDTGFLPPRERFSSIAPTTFIDDYGVIRGEVHDPTARRMEGVAGHAGLFATAADVAAFCRFFLDEGQVGETTILSPEIVRTSWRPHTPEKLGAPRGLGWDIASPFSHQRGKKFPLDGFGHTGWTGTSIWIDRASETIVILLANRNHPSESGSIRDLRIRIGTLAAEAVGYAEEVPRPASAATPSDATSSARTAAGEPEVRNGIDVLESASFANLRGRKVGLITNHTGINRKRRSTIDLLHGASGVELVRLFSPEHGIRGNLETDSIADGRDDATGLPIVSLYQSQGRKPSAAQLEGIDTLVFDIQDIGCRFYTYVSTMGLAMEAAHENDLRFVVLDRINPIGGDIVDGPVREGEGNDFVAFHDVPVRHGMTAGELAGMFREERKLGGLDLEVIPLEGWSRSMLSDDTGLPWINPSPNIRSLTQALLYPGIGLLEFTNLSVGRGTSTPFEVVGAPWITEGRLADRLADKRLPGIYFVPIRFTPKSSVYRGEDCGGVRLIITDRAKMNPIDVGLAIGSAIQADYPATFTLEEKGNVLLRHPPTHRRWIAAESIAEMRRTWEPALDEFRERRRQFLLYPQDPAR